MPSSGRARDVDIFLDLETCGLPGVRESILPAAVFGIGIGDHRVLVVDAAHGHEVLGKVLRALDGLGEVPVVIDVEGHRLPGPGGDEEPTGRRPLYLAEGESALHDFLHTPEDLVRLLERPVLEAKSNRVAPEQEKGFYRQFERRRPDGSIARGRRR